MKRKRISQLCFLIPLVFCLAYVFCVYAVYKRNLTRLSFTINKINNGEIRRNTTNFRYFDKVKIIKGKRKMTLHKENFVYTNGDIIADERKLRPKNLKTDIDRAEERKLKKKKEKYKKELKNKCKYDVNACQEIQWINVEENSRNQGGLLFNNFNSTKSPQWSSYADKGFAIVGEKGDLRRRLPQVLIIGAKKGGTRALLEFLRVHPSISAAGAELHFFDKYFHRGVAWYRSKLPLSLEGQLTVEKTPAYFGDKDVPARIKQILPSVRLLLVVRDPVIRAISDFAQSRSKHDNGATFRERALLNASSGLVNVGWAPIRGGLYARHYQRWRRYFQSSNIHVVSGENLVEDPAEEMAYVQDFLNIEKVINDRHFYFNASKGFPCLVKGEKNGKPHCLGSSKGRAHPVVDKNTLDILRNFYRPFNAKFYKLVGRTFNWP